MRYGYRLTHPTGEISNRFYISDRLATSEWGQKTIEQLAAFIQAQEPGLKGFEKRNLYRMRQFYETYPNSEVVSSLLTQLSWTHHTTLISRCKTEKVG